MKLLTLMIWLSVLMIGISGCSSTNSSCELIAVAYNEQDELSSVWYDKAATELAACGYEITHTTGSRGR